MSILLSHDFFQTETFDKLSTTFYCKSKKNLVNSIHGHTVYSDYKTQWPKALSNTHKDIQTFSNERNIYFVLFC